MTGELLGQLDDDASAVFLADFAESAIYTPRDGSLPPRSILAIVDRNPPQVPGMVERGPQDVLTIHVANSATAGISSGELDTGGDTVTIARRIGETAVVRRIVRLVAHDHGMLTLEVT